VCIGLRGQIRQAALRALVETAVRND